MGGVDQLQNERSPLGQLQRTGDPIFGSDSCLMHLVPGAACNRCSASRINNDLTWWKWWSHVVDLLKIFTNHHGTVIHWVVQHPLQLAALAMSPVSTVVGTPPQIIKTVGTRFLLSSGIFWSLRRLNMAAPTQGIFKKSTAESSQLLLADGRRHVLLWFLRRSRGWCSRGRWRRSSRSVATGTLVGPLQLVRCRRSLLNCLLSNSLLLGLQGFVEFSLLCLVHVWQSLKQFPRPKLDLLARFLLGVSLHLLIIIVQSLEDCLESQLVLCLARWLVRARSIGSWRQGRGFLVIWDWSHGVVSLIRVVILQKLPRTVVIANHHSPIDSSDLGLRFRLRLGDFRGRFFHLHRQAWAGWGRRFLMARIPGRWETRWSWWRGRTWLESHIHLTDATGSLVSWMQGILSSNNLRALRVTPPMSLIAAAWTDRPFLAVIHLAPVRASNSSLSRPFWSVAPGLLVARCLSFGTPSGGVCLGDVLRRGGWDIFFIIVIVISPVAIRLPVGILTVATIVILPRVLVVVLIVGLLGYAAGGHLFLQIFVIGVARFLFIVLVGQIIIGMIDLTAVSGGPSVLVATRPIGSLVAGASACGGFIIGAGRCRPPGFFLMNFGTSES